MEREKNEQFFSGRVKLRTLSGIVEADIHSAEVLKGREILEKGRIENTTIDSGITSEAANLQLVEELEKLPAKSEKSIGDIRWWRRKWQLHLESYGEESIFDLFPDALFERPKRLSRIINAILRNDIQTKKQLGWIFSRRN